MNSAGSLSGDPTRTKRGDTCVIQRAVNGHNALLVKRGFVYKVEVDAHGLIIIFEQDETNTQGLVRRAPLRLKYFLGLKNILAILFFLLVLLNRVHLERCISLKPRKQ